MMIEFCGNCKLGEETNIYPGTCPYLKKASGRHCKPQATTIQAQ